MKLISCPKCNHSIKRRASTLYILCASCKHCFKDLQITKGEGQTASETPKTETALPDTQIDKWAFCPEKKCIYCLEDLGKLDLKDRIITGCRICGRSFVE